MVVGRHLVRDRLMREMNLLVKARRHKRSTTNSRHGYRRYQNLMKDRKVTRPDQVWVADITYVRLGAEDVYLSVLMDVYTRSVRAWNLSWSLGFRNLRCYPYVEALQRYPAPDIQPLPIKVRNMPQDPMLQGCYEMPVRKSAWQPSVRRAKTVMQNG